MLKSEIGVLNLSTKSKSSLQRFVTKCNPGTILRWNGTQIDFLQLLNHKIFQKVILVSFLHLSKLCIFAKLGGCGSKTKPATPS